MSRPTTSVSIERYAEVLAFVLHYRAEPLEQTLEAVGLTLDDWNLAEAFWTGELSLYEKRGQGLLSMRFAGAYGKMRRRLARYGVSAAEAARRAEEVVGQHPRSSALGAAPGAAPAPDGPRAATAGEAPAPALPSFALAQQQLAQHPPTQAPGYAQPPPARAPDAASRPLPGTFFLSDTAKPASSLLPFQAPEPGSPPPQVAQAAGGSEGLRRPGSGSTAGPAPANPAKGGTSFLPDGAQASPSLPFQAPQGPALPAGELPALPALSLEHYVALLVELSQKPEQAHDILRRYRIAGPEEKQQLDATFRAHFRVNPQLRQRYELLVQRFSAFSR